MGRGARLVSCTHSAPDGQGRKIQGLSKAHLPPLLSSRGTLDFSPAILKFSRVASGSLQPGYHGARISSCVPRIKTGRGFELSLM